MTTARRPAIIDALRHRIQRGLQAGAVKPGDRLPSTREVAADLAVDPRVVAAAYRALETEGLVQLRARSGVYLTPGPPDDTRLPPRAEWAIEALHAAVTRGIPLQLAANHLRTVAARRLSVVVAASMADQVDGLVRELHVDFGIDARGVIIDAVSRIDRWPRALERADLVITTPAHVQRLRRFDRGAGRPLLVAGVRPGLLTDEWRLALRGMCYVIVADRRFASVVREFLREAPDSDRVSIRVAGRDPLHDIAPDAPTYITEAARRVIGRTRLPGRLIASARILDDESIRRIIECIVLRHEAPA